ncbi:MAG TPA: DUF4386 domain-containing protein [Candidatus Eremiobacteraceae bacterium]|nr:DUF4386 domain-containing protein [Candidatus Eremiobacteraceae bacterium]
MGSNTASVSPSRTARIAGAFYVLNIIFGALAATVAANRGTLGTAVLLIATASYVVVTLLFYRLFKPVSPALSLIAAIFSLLGCLISAINAFGITSSIDPLALFGLYCLTIGYLIIRSTFLPRTLGVLMLIAGLGWLTFAVPDFGHHLMPFNVLPGLIGETALTLWLLIAGVNDQRWAEQAA